MSELSGNGSIGGVRLLLGDITAARASYERLLRAYAASEIKESLFRGLVYGLAGYLAYIKHEGENEIQKRIASIEKRLEDIGKAGK